MLTFLAPGLLHEYNFSVHNHVGYRPGHATLFFVLMGMLMLVEAAVAEWLWARCSPRVQAALAATPSVIIAFSLQLLVLPVFAPLFFRSWSESGLLDSLKELLPHCAVGAQ